MTYPPPYPHQPWPPRPLAPSKGTAVTAAVLALLLGALMAFGTIMTTIAVVRWSVTHVLPMVILAAYALITIVLLTGGSLLLARKRAGQIMTIIGAGLVLALSVLSFSMQAYGGVMGLIAPALALPAIIFAAVPPTNTWLTPTPYPGGFPPPQGFPAPMGYPGYPPPGYPAQRPY